MGALGIIQDTPAYDLPPEAWSGGTNVRMRDNSVWKSLGFEKVLDPPSIVAYSLVPAFTVSGNQLFAYPGLAAVHATDGVAHADITRLSGAYTGGKDDLWNGGSLGNIVVLNNGKDIPQVWDTPALATDLIDLPNWPANTEAKVIRVFRRFLVAFDVTKSGTREPQLVKWSDRADLGAVPSTWDETDPTNRAGEWPLIETDGAIIDALPLAGVNFIYKEDEIHTMEEIGGNFVFRFTKKFGQVGLLAQRCVKEYQKKDRHVHVLMTPEDVVQHDGFQMTSLLDDKMRRFYKGRIDPDKANRSFLGVNYVDDEMWVCIIEAGEEYASIALIINMKDGTLSLRDLPKISGMAWAAIDPNAASTTYDSQTQPFDATPGQFGQRIFAPGSKRMILVDPDDAGAGADPSFYLGDQTFQFDGQDFLASIERTGLAVVGQDRFDNPKVDTASIKLVTEVWPRVRLINGTSINVYVGAQDSTEGPVTWSPAMPFNPATDDKVDVDPPIEGRYIAVRFETPANTSVQWKLDGYDLEIFVIGKF